MLSKALLPNTVTMGPRVSTYTSEAIHVQPIMLTLVIVLWLYREHDHDQGNSYKRKHLTETLLTVLEVSPLSSWTETEMHGARAS